MKPLRIAVVVGSIRQDSYSRRFAQALARLAPDDVKFDFIRIDDLPPNKPYRLVPIVMLQPCYWQKK